MSGGRAVELTLVTCREGCTVTQLNTTYAARSDKGAKLRVKYVVIFELQTFL